MDLAVGNPRYQMQDHSPSERVGQVHRTGLDWNGWFWKTHWCGDIHLLNIDAMQTAFGGDRGGGSGFVRDTLGDPVLDLTGPVGIKQRFGDCLHGSYLLRLYLEDSLEEVGKAAGGFIIKLPIKMHWCNFNGINDWTEVYHPGSLVLRRLSVQQLTLIFNSPKETWNSYTNSRCPVWFRLFW